MIQNSVRTVRQKSCLNSCLKHWKHVKFEHILIFVKNPASGIKESDFSMGVLWKNTAFNIIPVSVELAWQVNFNWSLGSPQVELKFQAHNSSMNAAGLLGSCDSSRLHLLFVRNTENPNILCLFLPMHPLPSANMDILAQCYVLFSF